MGIFNEVKTVYLSGTLWVDYHPSWLDLYNPNTPYATANMRKTKAGDIKLFINEGAPRAFRTEVQEHLDKLKTILILGR